MSKASAARVALVALLALASSLAAWADTPAAQTRVTIRGTGSNVTIERTQAPARKRSFEKIPGGALGDAIRFKAGGADDSTVIAYLRAHQDELPSVIENGAVRQLRKAGAGKSVVAYLATVAAVDIGPTGEGHPHASYPAPALAMPGYEPSYGYPYGATYAAPYSAGFFPRRSFASRRSFFHPGRPVFRRTIPPHGFVQRHRIPP